MFIFQYVPFHVEKNDFARCTCVSILAIQQSAPNNNNNKPKSNNKPKYVVRHRLILWSIAYMLFKKRNNLHFKLANICK